MSKFELSLFLLGFLSDFIFRSAETGLGRWILVVTVISVDAYHFLAFSDLTCLTEDTGMCFLVALCCGGVTFLLVWIFPRSLGVICYGRRVLSVCQKNYFKNWCLKNSQPIVLFLTYLNLRLVSAIMICYFLSNFYFFTKW